VANDMPNVANAINVLECLCFYASPVWSCSVWACL